MFSQSRVQQVEWLREKAAKIASSRGLDKEEDVPAAVAEWEKCQEVLPYWFKEYDRELLTEFVYEEFLQESEP